MAERTAMIMCSQALYGISSSACSRVDPPQHRRTENRIACSSPLPHPLFHRLGRGRLFDVPSVRGGLKTHNTDTTQKIWKQKKMSRDATHALVKHLKNRVSGGRVREQRQGERAEAERQQRQQGDSRCRVRAEAG
jgi:hypothetical protein